MLQQTAVALSAGFAGVLLLLLLGTQVLDWQWPLAFFVAVLGFGAYRVRRRRIPLYTTAQQVDRLLGLDDRLSTAFYFRHVAERTPELAGIVEKEALERVQERDLKHALPVRFPSAGYVALALAIAAVGLFAIRYGVLKTLDLERPLARIDFDTFRTAPKVEAATNRKSVVQEHLEKQLQQLGLTVDEAPEQTEREAEQPNPTELQSIADEQGGNEKGVQGKSQNSPPEGPQDGESGEKSSGEQSGESKEDGGGESSKSEQGQKASANQAKSPQKQGANSSSVMDKMKDAFANLLNKLGANQPKGEESAANQSQQQDGKTQMSQKGTQGQGKAQGENQPSSDPSGGKESDSGQQTPGQQQQASQSDSNTPGTESAKSGMGKTDGDKAIKDAEQLAAMGKISEIFGKRAAEIQGEMSVEVPSGKQQLKTAYSNNSATHSGAVSESQRNEIPLMYQAYVQRYFEEVRKTAAPAATKAKPANQ